MLSERDRAYCEKIAARQDRAWFERRGLDYALLGTGLLLLLSALGGGELGDDRLVLGMAGFLIGSALAMLRRSRDERLLASLYRRARESESPRA